jgi:hypothetical protein
MRKKMSGMIAQPEITQNRPIPAIIKRIDEMRSRKSARTEASAAIPISSSPQPSRLSPAGES